MPSDRAEGDGSRLEREIREAGDSSFVDDLRAVDDADELAAFAEPWLADPRPASRQFLLDYLDHPLNAYRHEGLIKRLFKKAEAAGDDRVMAKFLVLFDRSIRRVRRRQLHLDRRQFETEAEAHALRDAWLARGASTVYLYKLFNGPEGRTAVTGLFPYEAVVHRGKTDMPRGRMVKDLRGRPTPDWAVRFRIDWHGSPEKPRIQDWPAVFTRLEGLRLFTVATRNYLRRRAWRYFRKLGRRHSDRYVAAISEALVLYRDEDVVDDLALLDNWGLVHALFHHSPILVAKPTGWTLAPGHSMAELAPSPIFDSLWAEATGAVVGLLARARSRAVLRWAVRRLEGDLPQALASYPLEGWVTLLGHDDPEVAGFAAEVLRGAEGLENLGADRWLALVESSSPAALEIVSEMAVRFVRPEEVSHDQALRLAILRPLPVARLGFGWLRKRSGPGDPRLLEAQCRPLRAEILRWLRASMEPSPGSILEFLDSRDLDARSEGLAWFRSEPGVRDDVETWRKLLESPYDDVRLALVADLEARAEGVAQKLDSQAILGLWAAVLLNVHRGSRARPSVVGQIVRRLEANPESAPSLLPLLGVALRSVRGPERRAGLVAVVRLAESRVELGSLVRSAFPELQWA